EKDGKMDGEAKYYDYDGKLYTIYNYGAGHFQKVQYLDKKENVVSTTQAKSWPLDIEQYYADGFKKSKTTYNEKENIEGTQTFYYPSGRILETDEYVDGDMQGYLIAYYPNGAKKVENHYAEGKTDGYHCSYFQHGQKKEEGWNSSDNAQGTWLSFNELGALLD